MARKLSDVAPSRADACIGSTAVSAALRELVPAGGLTPCRAADRFPAALRFIAEIAKKVLQRAVTSKEES